MKKIIWLMLMPLIFFLHNAFAADKKPELATPIVAQFFGIWMEHGQTWEEKFRSDTPFDQLNRLYVAFGKIVKTREGHFSIAFDGNEAHVKAIMDRMQVMNSKADIFLVVGGDNGNNSFGGASQDPLFADNVATFLKNNGFNGFDIDWENGLDKQKLNALVTNLSVILHSAGLKLTLDVWSAPRGAYDMTVLKEQLNQINIMSYGEMSGLNYSVAEYLSAGFPAAKMIGGIETEADYVLGADTLGPTGSITQKAQYALTHDMAGMMAWRLDNDYTISPRSTYPTYRGAQQLWLAMNQR